MEGLSYVSRVPFVVLDLINLSEVTINVEKKTSWIEAGATTGIVYYKIAEKSPTLGFPGGICPTVGVGGHYSGGGYDTLLRKYGQAGDNVIDARIVNANGRILDRKSMGKDLFWAIRGGGGASFGVITAWKVQLVDVPKTVTVFSVNRNVDQQNGTELWHRWQYVAPQADKDLFVGVIVSQTPFPHRAGVLYQLAGLTYWQNSKAANASSYISWSLRYYQYMTPYVSSSPREAYYNYRDLDIGVNNPNGKTSYARASIWGKPYYKDNFDRLVRVKTIVDPTNIFKNEQSIPDTDRTYRGVGEDAHEQTWSWIARAEVSKYVVKSPYEKPRRQKMPRDYIADYAP